MIPACVRRSDGRTESIIAKTALCIASYADALSKIKWSSQRRFSMFHAEPLKRKKSGQLCVFLNRTLHRLFTFRVFTLTRPVHTLENCTLYRNL